MALVAIDADIVLYKAASAAQHVFYDMYPKGKDAQADFLIERFESFKDMNTWLKREGKDEKDFDVVRAVECQEEFQAKLICDNMMKTIIRNTGATSMVSYLSDDKNFRHRLAVSTPYKVRDADKPIHYQAVKDHLKDHWNAVVFPDLEADDALGIASAQCEASDMAFIQATIDKDLKQIPGLYYDIDKQTLTMISFEDSLKKFFTQVLTGDGTDSIPGLPSVGEKTAEKVLASCKNPKDYVDAVREYYIDTIPKLVDKGKWKYKKEPLPVPEDPIVYLNEQANLLFIRRHPAIGVDLS